MSTPYASKDEYPDDFIWMTYLDASKAEDKARPKNWEGSTNGILTFTGLFAGTVAAFIIESYPLLSPNSSDRTNALLEQLFVAMANTSSNQPVTIPAIEPFSTPLTAVAVNILWFWSLLIALMCALLSTLVQEWSRAYVQDIARRKVLHDTWRTRASNHIFIRMGVNRYGMDQFVSWIVALVHLSVYLFACGLIVFLYSINPTVAGASTALLGSFLTIYCVTSLLPLLDKSCPYRTPVTYVMAAAYWLILEAKLLDMRMQYGKRPSDEGGDFRDIVTRQYTAQVGTFMTESRFDFMWAHTYIHVPDQHLGSLIKSLVGFLRFQGERTLLLGHLCADEKLMLSLNWHLSEIYMSMARGSNEAVDADVFELVALLSEGMFALEVAHHGDHLDESICTSSFLLDLIGEVSRIAELKGPSRLAAQICLARVRWSLLKLCQKAFEKNMPAVRDKEVPTFIRRASHFRFRLDGLHPNAVLLTLITGFYDGHKWVHKDVSTLQPLHDNKCCRDWRSALTPEGFPHLIACNAFSTVAFLLDATDSQREGVEGVLFGFFERVKSWYDALTLLESSRQKMPSEQFVSVLRSAGLDEWMTPESTFITDPRDGPNFKFLTTHHARKSGPHCVHLLRDLAERVNFAAYHASHVTVSSAETLAQEPCTTPVVHPALSIPGGTEREPFMSEYRKDKPDSGSELVGTSDHLQLNMDDFDSEHSEEAASLHEHDGQTHTTRAHLETGEGMAAFNADGAARALARLNAGEQEAEDARLQPSMELRSIRVD